MQSMSQSYLTLQPTDYSSPGSSVHGDFLDKNTGVGCHALLQGILPTQGSNLGLLHCRWIPYHLATREALEYWSGQPIPSSGDHSDSGMGPGSPALQTDSSPAGLPRKPVCQWYSSHLVHLLTPSLSPHCVHMSTLSFQRQLINHVLTSSRQFPYCLPFSPQARCS